MPTNKIAQLLPLLHQGLYEKEEALRLTLLSALAGESIFLLGRPGVAKSLIARRLKFAFSEAKAFEYLMSRFSTPDEIFGPVSISKLKDEDKYERVTRNYLPEADIVFLDEIWKAGPSIQNALLTILNEKIYKNGEQEIRANIKAIISASNELPAENEGLEALWDRFLLRLVVHSIEDDGAFNAMISDIASAYEDNIPQALKITQEEYADWSKKIDAVELPEEVFSVIRAVRFYINEFNAAQTEPMLYISDRRWRKIIRLLRSSAFFNGRNAADVMDCFLIAPCIWNTPQQSDWAKNAVAGAIEKQGFLLAKKRKELHNLLLHFQADIEAQTMVLKEVAVEKPTLVEGKYFQFVMDRFYYKMDELAFAKLQNTQQTVKLYLNRGVNLGSEYVSKFAVKSKKENHLVIFDEYTPQKEYKLEVQLVKTMQKVPTAAHPAIEKEWDGQAVQLSEMASKIKSELAQLLESQSFKANLFVDNRLENIVETNILRAIQEMEQVELDIKQAVYTYKKLAGV